MATICKRGDRWQARVRRKGGPPTSRTFRLKADAEKWAAQVEVDAERGGFSSDRHVLERTVLADLIRRYRDAVVPSLEQSNAITSRCRWYKKSVRSPVRPKAREVVQVLVMRARP